MKARQILLASPLLQWYLKHGLVVTKIYQINEFEKDLCFQKLVWDIRDARRQGDIDADTGIIADTMKLIGTSGYGSLIMDKTKHRAVKYIQGENETCQKVNDPLFQKLECLDEEEQIYEKEMAKRKIKLDLPIQLGYFSCSMPKSECWSSTLILWIYTLTDQILNTARWTRTVPIWQFLVPTSRTSSNPR